MASFSWNKSILQHVSITFSLGMVIAYFVFHAISGDLGLFAMFRFSKELVLVQEQLDQVRSERARLELHVNRLRPESLDLDLLDEQARKILGLADASERVVMIN
jgi:cell division protein FtsB